jgi:hypothetical protein
MSPPVSAPRAFVPATVLAGTIVEHGLGFLDAVYLCADAARDSGLADGVSDARLQRCIGTAFMGALPKTSPSTTTTTTVMAPEGGTQT